MMDRICDNKEECNNYDETSNTCNKSPSDYELRCYKKKEMS